MKFLLLFIILLTQSVMAATLVASYSFEGNTNDQSSFGNHATNYGATFVSGVYGQAVYFDGSSFLRAVDSASLDIAGSYSIMSWVKTNADTNGNFASLIAKHFTHWDRSYGLFLNTTRAAHTQFDTVDNINYSLDDTTSLNDNSWHHVASTYNATTGIFKLFVDGVLRSSANTGTLALMNSSVPLLIGAYANSPDGYTNRDFLTGALDEVKIYNGALSDGEISTYFTNVVPEPHSFLFVFSAIGFLGFYLLKK